LLPQYADVYYNRAHIREQQGNFAAALEDYRNYLKFGIGKPRKELAAVMDRAQELKDKLGLRPPTR
jgi:tetratricopeptide (TPR) repeat protein